MSYLKLRQTGVGQRTGRYVQIGPSFRINTANRPKRVAVYLCDCGRYVVREPSKVIQFSGCNACAEHIGPRTHGAAGNLPEHYIWAGMLRRCRDFTGPHGKTYAQAGIKVCDRWQGPQGFQNFFDDVGPRPTPKHQLDRYPDKEGDYCPSNVRWTTCKENQRNRRNNRLLTVNGETKCLSAWAEEYGMSRESLWYRLEKMNLPVEEAITFPVRPRRTCK